MMNTIEDSIELNGYKLTFQTNKLAQAATTSVFARLGDTCVLVTVMVGNEREDLDYLPLTIEYVEKLYAGGRIKGSRWVKREGRPSDDAILKGRLIDRTIRPLFPKNYRRDTQIIITLLSVDGVNPPEILGAIATSCALHLSPIPWAGPVSTTRIGYVRDSGTTDAFVNHLSEDEVKLSVLDLIVSSSKEKIIMIEAKSEELSEALMEEALERAKKENSIIIDFINKFKEKAGRAKYILTKPFIDDRLLNLLKKDYKKKINEFILRKEDKETEDEDALQVVVEKVYEKYKEEYDKKTITKAVDYLSKLMIKEKTLKDKIRIDGRKLDEIRNIETEVSILPRTHGSAIFERGTTQVLSIATLGSPSLEQFIESPAGEEVKRYIHHYYMPPYSVGEVGRVGFPSRREIGHGALAEKAIEPVLPTEKEFPYTIRVVSEVLSSNGSTSMAATCGSTLALMDAGVPIKAMVAGIAMGLMSKSDKDYLILTDIIGLEDFSGEMDFKIAGTENGITAIQLDVKNEGLTKQIIKETLEKAKVARLFILEKMKQTITKPRGEVSKFAPKVIVLTPPADKIGEIIGPGGKNIRNLIAKTGTDINVSDDGKVSITGVDRAKVEEAAQAISNIVRELQVGEEFEGEVKRILPFGAFVEMLPGKEGLVHVSKMGRGYVRKPEDVVKLGQKVKVKIYQIDNQGRVNLQMILDQAPQEKTA